MASRGLHEALIDVQTIVIVALLYGLLREEQSNAYLRTWLSINFPLGLLLLAPLTVAAISAILLVFTAIRIIVFVTKRDLVVETKSVLHRFDFLRARIRVYFATNGKQFLMIFLIVFGLALSLYSNIVVSIVPFVALGISCIILGLTALSLPRRLGGPGIRAVLQGATLGLEAQLEQHDVRRAIYLPPSDGGVISAYVPLISETEHPSLSEMRQAPKSLTDKNQKGVLVYPVGSELSRVPDLENGLSDEERLKYVLVESANLCSQVMAEETESRVIVRMKGADLTLQGQKYLESLGSLPSSLAACVIALSRNKPLILIEERTDGDSVIAVFQLLDGLN